MNLKGPLLQLCFFRSILNHTCADVRNAVDDDSLGHVRNIQVKTILRMNRDIQLKRRQGGGSGVRLSGTPRKERTPGKNRFRSVSIHRWSTR